MLGTCSIKFLLFVQVLLANPGFLFGGLVYNELICVSRASHPVFMSENKQKNVDGPN
jgi:hypothetical protein